MIFVNTEYMNRFIATLLLFLTFVMNGYSLDPSKTILTHPKSKDILVDGVLDCAEWGATDSVVGFCSPWIPIGKDNTVFKCFCSEAYFNFCFDVGDKNIVNNSFSNESSVSKGDRVELFFSADSVLSQYFCMEISSTGHVLDYAVQYYRKIDYSWKFEGYDIAAKYTPKGYVVEGRIPISELEKLGIKAKQSFYLGLFRADFTDMNSKNVIWYSWLDPQKQVPDFHVPTAFGICKYVGQ